MKATCGNCNRSWCDTCDPAPSAMCHWCHGRGKSIAPWDDSEYTWSCDTCGQHNHDLKSTALPTCGACDADQWPLQHHPKT